MKIFSTIFLLLIAPFVILNINAQNTIKPIVLPSNKNEDVNLQTLIGEKGYYILVFWSIDEKKSLEFLENIKESSKEWTDENDLGIVIINIDKDAKKEKADAYAKKKEWTYETLYDPEQKTKNIFKYTQLPHIVIVKNDGKFVKTYFGYNQGDEYLLDEKISELFEDSPGEKD